MTRWFSRLVWFVVLLSSCAAPDGETISTVRLAYDEEPPEPPDAVVVEQDIPDSWACGEEQNVHIRMRNVGISTWQPSVIKLGTFQNLSPFTGPSRVDFQSPVGPNGEVSFDFSLRAPIFATNKGLAFSMLKQQGTQWFGELAEQNAEVSCAGEDFHAQIQDYSFPTNVVCGQTFGVPVTMRNTGTVAWLPGELVALGAVDDDDPFASSTRYPIGDAVLPSDDYTFHMTFTAPPGTDDYLTDWRMVRDAGGPWFGQTLAQWIHVDCEELDDDSDASWTLPPPQACSDHFQVQVNVVNTGTTTWSSSGNQGYELRQKPGMTPLGEFSYSFPPNVHVPPGASHTFTLTLHAPPTEGHFPVGYQLYNRDRHAFFGGSVVGEIETTCTPDNARVVESSFASEVGCGRQYPIRVRMRNTGLATWSRAAGYALGNSYGTLQFLPPTSRVELPPNVTVGPNEEYLFEFTLTAPFVPNPEYFQSWRMVHGGNFAFFGDGVSKFVNVRCDSDMADVENVHFPDSLNCGDTYPASITFRNMGSAPWLNFYGYELGAVDGSDPLAPPIIEMPIDVGVLPGQPYTFAFTLLAPYRDAWLYSDWQMKHNDASFGPVVGRNIRVNCPPYGAKIVSVASIDRPSCDPEVDMLVTVRNAGTRAWGVDIGLFHDLYSFAEIDPSAPADSLREIEIPRGIVVRPGSTYAFTVTLPREEPEYGLFRSFWRMLRTPGEPGDWPGATGPEFFGATARLRAPPPCNPPLSSVLETSPASTR